MIGTKPLSAASRIAICNRTYGLNEPLDQQFVTYLDQVVHGNLGTSYSLQQPVSTLIAQRLPRDFLLLGLSTVLALLIALPLGIYQAVRRNGIGDYLCTGIAFTLYSMPDFFFAILLIAVFSVQLQILPPEAPQATTVASVGTALRFFSYTNGSSSPSSGSPPMPIARAYSMVSRSLQENARPGSSIERTSGYRMAMRITLAAPPRDRRH